MNLAFRYPLICWNCACLISDCGGNNLDSEDDEELLDEELEEETNESSVIDFNEDDDEDEDEDEEETEKQADKKKKSKTNNYGKVAAAIGKISSFGVQVEPPDINKSSYTFAPDIKNNIIRYGMRGITSINDDLIKEIFDKRPFTSIEDFIERVKINKTKMLSLLKSGAFDQFGDRRENVIRYMSSRADLKKRLTMQNLSALIKHGLIPDEFDFEKRVFNFTTYIKKLKQNDVYYLDERAFAFLEPWYNLDNINISYDGTQRTYALKKSLWEITYKAYMAHIKAYITSHHDELLTRLNDMLLSEACGDVCQGSLSQWEMQSISCYIHEHELANVDLMDYNVSNFSDLSVEPTIAYSFKTKDGKLIHMFKIDRIAGTVLDKNKLKGMITILTTDGVVTVKMAKPLFAVYDRQISEIGADGKKHVIEKSIFARGNKVILTGIREGENEFRIKKYKNTPYHSVEKIVSIENGEVILASRSE